ncbi:hypothetical protein [Paraburkholderia sp. RL17-373-BIF-A]|uniref:hypothetical protein n=1 Tax=Paraburkholderia sp. RL17-373-BIF-A TaxID=3031629 RepID=UPI0038B6EE71
MNDLSTPAGRASAPARTRRRASASRAAFRNEVKTRLRDDVYVRLQDFKQAHFIESDSAALARLAEILLCGIVRTQQPAVSDQQGPTVAR